MKKVALVFVLAVFVPSLVLAWLAVRSLRDQQLVLERQQSLLCQGVTDAFAKEINDYLADQQREFDTLVENLVTNPQPREAAASFDDRLRRSWPLAEVGFCVSLAGDILCPTCPSPTNRTEARVFCADNGAFLGNRESAEVYWNDFSKGGNPNIAHNPAQQLEAAQSFSLNQPALKSAEQNNAQLLGQYVGKAQQRKINPAQQSSQVVALNSPPQEPNVSKVVSTEAEFRQLIGDASDGMVARFLQNKLRLMFWHRLERDPQLVFGAQLNLAQVSGMLRAIVEGSTQSQTGSDRYFNRINYATDWAKSKSSASLLPDEICVVILDDNANPIAASNPEFQEQVHQPRAVKANAAPNDSPFAQVARDLKHPFVATEIGEALPHWEVAAYLLNPDKLKQSARTLQLTLGLLILVLVLAIGVGSWLIVSDLNRQVKLAQQKTDFVSNVSHELKTPLTSIRMFSELLAEGRVDDPAKQRSYSNIIASEAARLTRLINNVLDFSRLERGEKKYNFRDCDLVALARDTTETYRPHLENHGFKFECSLPPSALPVRGDSDALAQIIVNLLSNAEKYSDGPKEVALQVLRRDGPLPCAEVKVLDRGLGVPRGSEEKIFEQFYRAHDSLNSGIQGSGLGLTLARQIARAHGGDVVYEPREGGGSCFALRLPLQPDSVAADVRRL